MMEERVFDCTDTIYKTMLSTFSIENSLSPAEKVIVA